VIRAIMPEPRVVLREWMCVYCKAYGPAASEAAQQRLTRQHLDECRARKRYEARVRRAMAAMEALSK